MPLEGIDHLDLVVSDLERALGFYEALLAPLGYERTREIEGEQGERIAYMSRAGSRGALGLREAHDGREQRPFDRYEIGVHHVCFGAPDREAVDAVFAAGVEAGARVESVPREYDYTPGYYSAFLRDPDGIKLEVLHRP